MRTSTHSLRRTLAARHRRHRAGGTRRLGGSDRARPPTRAAGSRPRPTRPRHSSSRARPSRRRAPGTASIGATPESAPPRCSPSRRSPPAPRSRSGTGAAGTPSRSRDRSTGGHSFRSATCGDPGPTVGLGSPHVVDRGPCSARTLGAMRPGWAGEEVDSTGRVLASTTCGDPPSTVVPRSPQVRGATPLPSRLTPPPAPTTAR